MQIDIRILIASCVAFFLATETRADLISFFDFEDPNNRFGWTVSSHDSNQFRFEKADGLFWESSGGNNSSGGLRFFEQPTWNWSETFVAPPSFVEAINGAQDKRISYDLATNADGGGITPPPPTYLYIFGNGMFLYTSAGQMPLENTGFHSYEVDLLDTNRQWRDRFGDPNIFLDFTTVQSVVNNLVDLHIQADHNDSNSSSDPQSAWLDNVGLNVTAVPEPSSTLIIGIGMLLVVRRRRR